MIYFLSFFFRISPIRALDNSIRLVFCDVPIGWAFRVLFGFIKVILPLSQTIHGGSVVSWQSYGLSSLVILCIIMDNKNLDLKLL